MATDRHHPRRRCGARAAFSPGCMAPERRGPLLVTPAIIVLFLMNIFPLLWSFGLSFFNYRANRQTRADLRGARELRARADRRHGVWERFQTTALIVGSSVLLQLILGFLLALLFERQFPLRRHPADAGADADDALAGRGRRVLQAVLRADLRAGQPVHQRIFTGEPFALLATPMGAHHRHRRRRRLDVVAVRHAPGAGRPGQRAEVPLRGGRGRPRVLVAALPHHHLPLHPQPAAAGDPVPHDRDLQAVRHRLHHHRRAARARRPRRSASTSTAWRSRTSAPASRRRSPTSCCSS